ncbi:DUF2946 domain-containing protein [Trinickia sp. NRRL B-1857]|uniref:DUF2946 domain-containing protein n=1 Tax=Trinickia sp. NRRL B-1857 TaxID=3162879 RepID=UPI003D27B5A6
MSLLRAVRAPVMLDRRLRRFGTLLGLLAIWMTVLAPAISQTLAAHDRAKHGTMFGVQCSAHAMTEPSAHGSLAQRGHSHDASDHGQACGYCAFFSHLPIAPSLAQAFLPTRFSSPAPDRSGFAEPTLAERFLAAQPRAPPVVS